VRFSNFATSPIDRGNVQPEPIAENRITFGLVRWSSNDDGLDRREGQDGRKRYWRSGGTESSAASAIPAATCGRMPILM